MQEGGHVVIQGPCSSSATHLPCSPPAGPGAKGGERGKNKSKRSTLVQPQPQMFTEPLPGRRWQLQAEPNVPGALPHTSPALYPPRKPIKGSHISSQPSPLKTFLPKHWESGDFKHGAAHSHCLAMPNNYLSPPLPPTSPSPKFIEQSSNGGLKGNAFVIGTVFKGL